MAISIGDILKVKTTGENVIVLGEGNAEGETVGNVLVRRAALNRETGVYYTVDRFFPFELEETYPHLDRQIAESAYVENALSSGKKNALNDIFSKTKELTQ